MRGSWPGRSPKTPGRGPRRWPATTSPSPRSSRCRRCGRSLPPPSRRSSNRPIRPPCRMRCGSLRSMRCSPAPARRASGRSTSAAWWRQRSRIGTVGPGIRICILMWRWRTRCRPSTGAGCRLMGGCCSRRRWRRRRPTTPRWSSTSAPLWASGSPNASDSDPTKRPIREIVGVDPRLNQRWSTRRAHINVRRGELAVELSARSWPATDPGRSPAAGPAGHLGDPGGEARTALAG